MYTQMDRLGEYQLKKIGHQCVGLHASCLGLPYSTIAHLITRITEYMFYCNRLLVKQYLL